MSWKKYFKVIKVEPGIVIWAKANRKIDLKNESFSPEDMLKLYEEDFPYLELTEAGKNKFFPKGTNKETMKDKVIDQMNNQREADEKTISILQQRAKDLGVRTRSRNINNLEKLIRNAEKIKP